MQVQKFMNREVFTVPVTASIEEAAALIKEHDIRHLPVVEGEKLIGLVTEGEIRGAIFPAMIEDIGVKDLMMSDPITVHPETLLEDAVRLVYRHKIGCLPVVDEDRNLKGIITVVDMLASLIELMGLLSESSRLDLVLPDRPDAFEEVSRVIQTNGGKIVGVSLSRLSEDQIVYLFRLEKMKLEPVVHDLETKGYEIISSLD
ncbi:MAG: CBS domain-containing protein [Deltaproteobacteria bacterium]|nr:CBS domain-containing protein [Deltaproteobacteria bacterium]MBW2052373.1 CBS domain-containing protein [Deltaproteobacteria bacterium]MBW2140857.1 CBS domain-containing protein [Deltaproteobacteria bacterium]MBW2322416.1 CBS domain-containing protein [Deltaproteobacteria bacterium]